ncbi:hypothetical protein QTP70_032173, partial [Hemibagrus guttatus]
TQLVKSQTNVQQMIQDRLKKIKEIKHSVDQSKSITDKKKADSVEVFTALIRSIERSQTELLEVMEEKQKAAERQAEGLIKELEQEITVLKRRDTELEQLSHTEEHLHLLQIYSSMCSPPHTKNWTEISINTDLSGDTVRTALSQLQQTLNEKLTKTLNDKLKETVSTELKRIQQYAVDVTLDPDTAHPELILSADGKQVTHGNKCQNLPDTPQRFNASPCVLGKQSFSSGSFYYEVKSGFWAVALRNENQYKVCADPFVSLTLREKVEVVGVFVDYEEGLVSFYDVKSRSHIYSFTVAHYSRSLLSEEQLQCSICLDVFTDPVTTPCGHNFCKSCITQCWEKSQHCHCPLCNEKFTKRPELKTNITLREVADHFKKKCGSDKPEVLCDACTGEKLKALKSCLDCCASLCKTHLAFHNNLPKHKKHKLINPVENLEDYICQKHERALELFCRDDQMCVCQFCTETNHKNHNTVPIEEESRERKTQLVKTQTDVQQMIQERLKKIKKIKHSVELSKRSTEKEKADSVEVFTALIRSIERSQAELLEVMEIYSSMCSPPHTKNWTEISINTDLSGDTVRTALSQLQQTLNEKLTKTLNDKLKETELKRIQQYAGTVRFLISSHIKMYISALHHCIIRLIFTLKS